MAVYFLGFKFPQVDFIYNQKPGKYKIELAGGGIQFFKIINGNVILNIEHGNVAHTFEGHQRTSYVVRCPVNKIVKLTVNLDEGLVGHKKILCFLRYLMIQIFVCPLQLFILLSDDLLRSIECCIIPSLPPVGPH